MKRELHDNEDIWKDARKGRISGSTAKDVKPPVRGGGYKIGVYRLIADRIAVPRDETENRMERGHSLEAEAVARLAQETKLPFKQVDYEIWVHDEFNNISYSPDGYIDGEIIETACEVKCLDSARHIEAYIEEKIPTDYDDQVIQAFVVNEHLQELYFVFYDPTVTVDIHYIIVKREDIAEKVAKRLEDEEQVLAFVDGWVAELTI
jgi:hypothetical protein